MRKLLCIALTCIVYLTCLFNPAFSQEKILTGTVSDPKGETLPGAVISIPGGKTVSTDANGKFQIPVPSPGASVSISFVGYTTQKIAIPASFTLNVILQPNEQNLDDVVVVGYGTAKKTDLTGAVASVKGEQLTQVATVDPVHALQGRVAGVEITNNSGQPGAGTRIRVRGVGTFNTSNPLYVVDGFQSDNISFLMPSDIEAIEILKDASATAIYGSRGANGVVIVTTKKGKTGKVQLNLNGYTGFQEVYNKLDLVDAAGYATLVTEAYQNAGQAVPANIAGKLQSAIQNNSTGTDWQDVVSQTGLITNYNLSVSGGSDQNKFLVSGGYFQQDGTVKNTGLKKYIIRINDDVNINKFIKAGVSANFTHSGNFASNNLLQGAVLTNPIALAYTPTGDYAFDDIVGSVNIARGIDEQKLNKSLSSGLLANAFIDVSLFSGLKFRSDFGINYVNNDRNTYLPQYYAGITDQRSLSSLVNFRNESTRWVWSNYLNYSKDLGKHSLSATLGEETQRQYFNQLSVTAFDVPADASLQYISASRNTSSTFTSDQQDESLLSFFGRANYAYNDRYLLTATLRFDQSSKFLKDVRLGVFPSFGAAWKISEEEFLKDVKAISSLKIRAGYGKVGNQDAARNYGYVTTALGNMNYVFNNTIVPGLIPTNLSNPGLKWETTVSTNIGVDASFFGDRLSLTADYFNKKTKDMIALLPVADFIGAGPADANVASMLNKGLELALNYRNKVGPFSYDLGVNFTKIKNEVTDLGGATPIANGNVISQLGNTTLTDVGREIGYFYGLKTSGIFKSQAEVDGYKNAANALIQPDAKPGDVRYVDVNNDGQITTLDRAYLGSASNPDFTYGLSLNLAYSNFDFKLLLYGVQGVEAVNALSYYLLKTSNSTGSWNNFYASRLDRWTPGNANSDQPRITAQDLNKNDQFSDRFVEDASYLRARNIEFGYTFSKGFLSKYKIAAARLSLAVDNLFTVTNYKGLDPEISSAGAFNSPFAYGVDFGNYPQPRTFRFGLNVQF